MDLRSPGRKAAEITAGCRGLKLQGPERPTETVAFELEVIILEGTCDPRERIAIQTTQKCLEEAAGFCCSSNETPLQVAGPVHLYYFSTYLLHTKYTFLRSNRSECILFGIGQFRLNPNSLVVAGKCIYYYWLLVG